MHKVRSPRKETLETEVGLLRFSSLSLSFYGEKILGNGKRAIVPCYEITRVLAQSEETSGFVAPVGFLNVGFLVTSPSR